MILIVFIYPLKEEKECSKTFLGSATSPEPEKVLYDIWETKKGSGQQFWTTKGFVRQF